jgi:hypothetical protein
MEGPLLLIKAWLVAWAVAWVIRRWVERVATPSPEFEAYCKSRPLLVAMVCRPGAAVEARSSLLARLGEGATAVATLGGWPWPNYALELELETQGDGLLLVRAIDCRLLRVRGPRPPALFAALRDMAPEPARSVEEVWAHRALRYALEGDAAPGGWKLLLDAPGVKLESLVKMPAWVLSLPQTSARISRSAVSTSALELSNPGAMRA